MQLLDVSTTVLGLVLACNHSMDLYYAIVEHKYLVLSDVN